MTRMRKRTCKRRNLKRLYQPQGWAWRGGRAKGVVGEIENWRFAASPAGNYMRG